MWFAHCAEHHPFISQASDDCPGIPVGTTHHIFVRKQHPQVQEARPPAGGAGTESPATKKLGRHLIIYEWALCYADAWGLIGMPRAFATPSP